MQLRLVALALVACGPTFHRTGPIVRDIPPPTVNPTRVPGPLSVRAEVPETLWRDRQALDGADHIYLDRIALREDAARYLTLVADLFPDPRASEQREAKRALAQLPTLAPYSLEATSHAYRELYGRLPLCARPPGVMWHCYPDPVAAPPARTPFELGEASPGVAVWTIHDLDAPAAWDDAIARVQAAHAIVLDLRDAAGSDPRPLLPWLERVTGRAPFKPLRAIYRPADLDAYVASYALRYVPEMRDRDVWASLVGEMPAAVTATAPPITVLVGPGCGPACELVARSLVTYANATIYGSVGAWGRLDRDEPALMVLPHSRIEIYFNATAYVLAADIERATGPTRAWNLPARDTTSTDVVAFAARELVHPAPPCGSFPAYTTVERIPATLRSKIPDALWLTSCPWTPEITIDIKAPSSAMDRFLRTCTTPVTIDHAYGDQFYVSTTSLAALTQLAQSDLVTRVDIRCEQPQQPN